MQADALIEKLCSKECDALIRYGGMFTIAMAYCATANVSLGALRGLLVDAAPNSGRSNAASAGGAPTHLQAPLTTDVFGHGYHHGSCVYACRYALRVYDREGQDALTGRSTRVGSLAKISQAKKTSAAQKCGFFPRNLRTFSFDPAVWVVVKCEVKVAGISFIWVP